MAKANNNTPLDHAAVVDVEISIRNKFSAFSDEEKDKAWKKALAKVGRPNIAVEEFVFEPGSLANGFPITTGEVEAITSIADEGEGLLACRMHGNTLVANRRYAGKLRVEYFSKQAFRAWKESMLEEFGLALKP